MAIALATAQGAAAAGWSAQPMSIPQQANGALQSVSCSSSTACSSVGSYINISGVQLTLAHAWNGTAWTFQTTPNPSGALVSNLNGVSCSAAAACTAVGYYYDADGPTEALAERWNGTNWKIQTIPSPAHTEDITLNGVWCSASDACTAVGDYAAAGSLDVMLVERWNGTSWKIQSTPSPTGATTSQLTGVSCRASDACTAVGYYETSTSEDTIALAQAWNGTSWKVQSLPLPTGTTSSSLTGVGCSTATACTAVGSYDASGGGGSLAERWNGTKWVIQSIPGEDDFSAVSCGAATACIAVGTLVDFEFLSADPATARWNGTKWTVQGTRKPPDGGFLNGVSCSAANVCTSVGSGGSPFADFARTGQLGAASDAADGSDFGPRLVDRGIALSGLDQRADVPRPATAGSGPDESSGGTGPALAERWNGTSWTIQTTPNRTGAAASYTDGVSCSGSTSCTAVGSYFNPTHGFETLAETWNGTSWKVHSTPNPSGQPFSYLSSVSCSAASACTAVGDYESFIASGPVAERWNGTSWTLQSTATPSHATLVEFNSVSCSAVSACTAVGEYYNASDTEVNLVERWNGTSWAIQTAPSPTGANGSHLTGVSCRASDACTAVGSYENTANNDVGFAEAWNGTSWKVQTIPLPSGANESNLNAVSCSAPTACTAVGGVYTAGGTSVADRWNGIKWSTQTITGATSSFSADSCASATACSAVGDAGAAAWNGSAWVIQPLATFPDVGFPLLEGVSCATAAACTAVGYISRAVDVSVAERHS